MNVLPVCGECKVFMRCTKNSIKVGVSSTMVAYGDKFNCPECGTSVIVGFGVPMEGTGQLCLNDINVKEKD